MLNPQISSFEDLSTTGIPFAKLPKQHRELLVTNDTLRKELAHALESSRLNESLSIQSKRTEEALRTKQVFVRYVSHEIRTPLNIANLGLQYLHKELDKMKVLSATPAIRETLDEVKVSSTIAVEILNDLLLYEKIDDGIFKLAFSTCSGSLSDRVNVATEKPQQRSSQRAPAVPVLSAPSSEVTTPITSVSLLLQQQTSISSAPAPPLPVSRTNSAVMTNAAIALRHASTGSSDESLTSSDSHSSSSSSGGGGGGEQTTKCAQITELQQPSVPNLRDKS
eukprot:gene1253-914_t